jgi:hypothetical protein
MSVRIIDIRASRARASKHSGTECTNAQDVYAQCWNHSLTSKKVKLIQNADTDLTVSDLWAHKTEVGFPKTDTLCRMTRNSRSKVLENPIVAYLVKNFPL